MDLIYAPLDQDRPEIGQLHRAQDSIKDQLY